MADRATRKKGNGTARRAIGVLAGGCSLLCGVALAQLAAFGIEGMGVVSTPANEVRASVRPDGQRIVWGSTDRAGGPGGWDLWQAQLQQGRWTDPQPLAINSADNDFDPAFSADGRWLYFFSNRPGGHGGDDLYRAPVLADGTYGPPQNLGAAVNGPGDEWAPTPSPDGRWLMFASNRAGGAGRHDLWMARWNGQAFVDPRPVPGINTDQDEFDAAWIDGGRGILFARSPDLQHQPVRLYLARCDGSGYVDAQPWQSPLNTADGTTLGPVVDASKPAELTVSGAARAPRAGQLDIYRVMAPRTQGQTGCLE